MSWLALQYTSRRARTINLSLSVGPHAGAGLASVVCIRDLNFVCRSYRCKAKGKPCQRTRVGCHSRRPPERGFGITGLPPAVHPLLGVLSSAPHPARPSSPVSNRLFAVHTALATMLGEEEDVFDSVTWETPADNNKDYDAQPNAPPQGPGFRQTTFDSEEGSNEPKWEGYLITSVRDPVKELPETKDTYVSYLVTAEVRKRTGISIEDMCSPTRVDRPSHILDEGPCVKEEIQRLCLSPRTSGEGLPSMCRTPITRQTPDGCVLRFYLRICNILLILLPEYITGDRFSPEFMERRRSECDVLSLISSHS